MTEANWAPRKIYILDMENLEWLTAELSHYGHNGVGVEYLASYHTLEGHPWIEMHRSQGKIESQLTNAETSEIVGEWFATREGLHMAMVAQTNAKMRELQDFQREAIEELYGGES